MMLSMGLELGGVCLDNASVKNVVGDKYFAVARTDCVVTELSIIRKISDSFSENYPEPTQYPQSTNVINIREIISKQ